MNLFKYMSEKRIEDILVKNKIRFTQPKYFNDPFELKLPISGISSKKNIENYLEYGFKDEIERLYKNEFSFLHLNISFDSFLNLVSNKKTEILKNIINTLKNEKFHSNIVNVSIFKKALIKIYKNS